MASSPVSAEDEGLDAASEMSQAIEISARGAPLNVFLQALFANTELEFELSEHLEGDVTGDYAGSIASVLKALSAEFNVTTRTEAGLVSVFPQIQKTTRSVTALLQPTETRLSKSQKNQSVQNEPDAVVERVFVLKHASAIDTQANKKNRSVVPGVLTQLTQLIEKLGILGMTNVGTSVGQPSAFTHSLIALPSLNAIAVKDLASRMDLYEDLIESLDRSSRREGQLYSAVTTHVSSSKWKVVQ